MSACTSDCGDICCVHCWDMARLRAEVERLREALTTIERTGAPGATIVARRSSDEHSCSWCRGMVTPCPVVTAREALKGGGK